VGNTQALLASDRKHSASPYCTTPFPGWAMSQSVWQCPASVTSMCPSLCIECSSLSQSPPGISNLPKKWRIDVLCPCSCPVGENFTSGRCAFTSLPRARAGGGRGSTRHGRAMARCQGGVAAARGTSWGRYVLLHSACRIISVYLSLHFHPFATVELTSIVRLSPSPCNIVRGRGCLLALSASLLQINQRLQ